LLTTGDEDHLHQNRRRAAAIRYAHRLAGLETITAAEPVRAVRGGASDGPSAPHPSKAPATADLVMTMLKHCPDTLAGHFSPSASRVHSAGQSWRP
jgi:hypothetical protein